MSRGVIGRRLSTTEYPSSAAAFERLQIPIENGGADAGENMPTLVHDAPLYEVSRVERGMKFPDELLDPIRWARVHSGWHDAPSAREEIGDRCQGRRTKLPSRAPFRSG